MDIDFDEDVSPEVGAYVKDYIEKLYIPYFFKRRGGHIQETDPFISEEEVIQEVALKVQYHLDDNGLPSSDVCSLSKEFWNDLLLVYDEPYCPHCYDNGCSWCDISFDRWPI